MADEEERRRRVEEGAGESAIANGGGEPTTSTSRQVFIRGQPVDITDTGIDPEFLEALPEEMREEVINQHFRERAAAAAARGRGSTATTATAGYDTGVHQELTRLNTEFLEALPDDIRRELVQAEELESRRRRTRAQLEEAQRTRAQNGGVEGEEEEEVGQPLEMDPATFLATLDPALRESVLMEQGDDFIASLPPSIMAEAQALRDQRRMRPRMMEAIGGLGHLHGSGYPRSPGSHNVLSSPKPYTPRRDAIQLLDKASLAVLVRLLYFPTLSSLNMLKKVLVNLCENGKTRADLIHLLIGMVQDGSEDEARLDSSFAQMTHRAARCLPGGGSGSGSGGGSAIQTPKGQSRPGTSTGTEWATPGIRTLRAIAGEALPHIVTVRSFETLNTLVTANEKTSIYFLTEQEQAPSNKKLSLKRSRTKDKERTRPPFYPITSLLSLLGRDQILKSSAAMDVLTLLLANITKTIANHLKQRQAAEVIKMQKAKDAASAEPGKETMGRASPARPAEVTTNGPSGDQDGVNSDTTMADAGPETSRRSEARAGSASQPMTTMDVDTTLDSQGAASSNPPTSMLVDSATKEKEDDAKPQEEVLFGGLADVPRLSTESLVFLVNPLIFGNCSSKTFQYTLSTMQNVMPVNGAYEAIAAELQVRAEDAASQTEKELLSLVGALKQATTASKISLAEFSPATSNQAKLLRLLKTIDYLFARQGEAGELGHEQVLGLSQGNSSHRPAIHESDDPFKVPTKVDMTDEKAPIEMGVRRIFERFQGLSIWDTLGRALTSIGDQENLQYIPTLLLPIIEAFLVVCKFIEGGSIPSRAKAGSVSPKHSMSNDHKRADEIFFTFTEDNKKILNSLVRNNPSLMSGSFSLLVLNPKVLDFDNKRNYFYQQLHKARRLKEPNQLHVNVRRQYVFEDSYHNLQRRSGEEIRNGKLVVKFYDEEGVDAGGVTREWFSVLAKQMFNPDYALFAPCAADRWTYQPNRASRINDEHLNFFKFVGRIIGKAIHDNRLLDCYFTRSFYKHILSKPVDYRDIESIDPEYYKSLVWILENDPTALELNFTSEDEEFGQTKVIELKPEGFKTMVTQENKHEYVRLVTEQKLTRSIQEQIKAFLDGFCDIVPAHLIRIFTEQELELLISGVPEINIEDWKANTEYHNFTAQSPTVQWFWRAIRSMSQEEMASVLQFVTGTSKVPLGGFAKLEGVNGIQRFQIHKDFASADRLPQAHTCFNQLDLPNYPDYETLRTRLGMATSEGAQGFGFA